MPIYVCGHVTKHRQIVSADEFSNTFLAFFVFLLSSNRSRVTWALPSYGATPFGVRSKWKGVLVIKARNRGALNLLCTSIQRSACGYARDTHTCRHMPSHVTHAKPRFIADGLRACYVIHRNVGKVYDLQHVQRSRRDIVITTDTKYRLFLFIRRRNLAPSRYFSCMEFFVLLLRASFDSTSFGPIKTSFFYFSFSKCIRETYLHIAITHQRVL